MTDAEYLRSLTLSDLVSGSIVPASVRAELRRRDEAVKRLCDVAREACRNCDDTDLHLKLSAALEEFA